MCQHDLKYEENEVKYKLIKEGGRGAVMKRMGTVRSQRVRKVGKGGLGEGSSEEEDGYSEEESEER